MIYMTGFMTVPTIGAEASCRRKIPPIALDSLLKFLVKRTSSKYLSMMMESRYWHTLNTSMSVGTSTTLGFVLSDLRAERSVSVPGWIETVLTKLGDEIQSKTAPIRSAGLPLRSRRIAITDEDYPRLTSCYVL